MKKNLASRIILAFTLLFLVSQTIFAQNTECRIVAHRGYYDKDEPNSIQAFNRALDKNFKWIEIDIRMTKDGQYVMSHNNAVTMYNYNGYRKYVKLIDSEYSTIKNYYWDNFAKYKLITLREVFQAMKGKDVMLILDKKAGENLDLLQIAIEEGMEHNIMVSWSLDEIIENHEILNQYPFIPIRFYASPYQKKYTQARELVQNPLFMDLNIDGDQVYTRQRLTEALSLGVPVSFSGCTMKNKKTWTGTASAVLANLLENISYKSFLKELNFNPDEAVNLKSTVSEINLKVGEELRFRVNSNCTKPAGYVYTKVENLAPLIAYNWTWGSNVEIYVKGRNAGKTNLIIFTSNGTELKIPVNVTK